MIGHLWHLDVFKVCLWIMRYSSLGFGDNWHQISLFPVSAYPAQLKDQESDQKWQLMSSVIWWWNRWEWKEKREHTWERKKHDGCFMTAPLALSVTFRGRVSLCYHPPLPGNYHKLHFPCPPEPRELSGRSGRIATFIIFFFSFHRLIF